MLINPNIDTFITKFQWTEDNASSYVSLLSMINPLGALFGTFIAKYMVRYRLMQLILLIDRERQAQNDFDRKLYNCFGNSFGMNLSIY